MVVVSFRYVVFRSVKLAEPLGHFLKLAMLAQIHGGVTQRISGPSVPFGHNTVRRDDGFFAQVANIDLEFGSDCLVVPEQRVKMECMPEPGPIGVILGRVGDYDSSVWTQRQIDIVDYGSKDRNMRDEGFGASFRLLMKVTHHVGLDDHGVAARNDVRERIPGSRTEPVLVEAGQVQRAAYCLVCE